MCPQLWQTCLQVFCMVLNSRHCYHQRSCQYTLHQTNISREGTLVLANHWSPENCLALLIVPENLLFICPSLVHFDYGYLFSFGPSLLYLSSCYYSYGPSLALYHQRSCHHHSQVTTELYQRVQNSETSQWKEGGLGHSYSVVCKQWSCSQRLAR